MLARVGLQEKGGTVLLHRYDAASPGFQHQGVVGPKSLEAAVGRVVTAVGVRSYRQKPLQEVRGFWEAEACGERYGDEQPDRRYQLEPEIVSFASFPEASGKRVLEIGVGMGADFVRWHREGAQAAGVDLTERAVAITRERLAQEGFSAEVSVADAEKLPFDDGEFDVVYSWGVLHHTPDTSRAIEEARRVLRPGGHLKVMVYHRPSWVAFAAWARFGMLRGSLTMPLREAVGHIESPGTKAFTVREARAMLDGMDHVSVRARLTRWDRKYFPGVARLFGHRLGWFLLMEGRQPV